jgi:cation transport ATPase
VNTVVLDKTGTVTRGVWRLLDVLPFGPCDGDQALALASGLEQGSAHPVAFEILSQARARGIRPEEISASRTHLNGVSGHWRGRAVKIGSAEYLAAEFAGFEDRPGPAVRRGDGRSCVYLALDGRPAALFVFGDELREGIHAAVADMQRRGLRLELVSGDGAETTRAVGLELGIAESLGGCLPAEKADFVARLQRQGRVVAMVGDGINDAPALAQADLGLSVFAGGSLGKEVADVTLMRGHPGLIPEFLEFAVCVRRRIRQNLILTFAYNAVAIPVAMAGLLTPLVAVSAMVASSLSVIGNTLRLVRAHSAGR